jgi:drug/metabolite transporter (DMT)-like permease
MSFINTHNTTDKMKLKGIMLMVIAMFCFAAMSTAISALAATHMPTTQMVFIRNFLCLMIITAWIGFTNSGYGKLKTTRIKQHIWRSAIGIVAMHLWFLSLTLLPLTTTMALSFTTPIFGTIFAVAILKEVSSWRRWVAVAVGFVGVLIIVQPGSEVFDAASLVVLTSSAIIAFTGIIVKSLTRTEHPDTITFYMALIMTPLSAPLALIEWQDVTTYQWFLLVLIAGFASPAQMLLTRAYRLCDMVTLLPFDYTRLLFAAVLGFVFFGEIMGMHTFIGAAVIMVSSIYIVHREAFRRKNQSSQAE